MLLKKKCEPESRSKRMAQRTAINAKQVHPTSKAPLCNFKETDKGRARILGNRRPRPRNRMPA